MLTFFSIIIFLFGLGLNGIYDEDTNEQYTSIRKLFPLTIAILILVRILGANLSNWLKALIFIAPVYIRFITLFITRVYKRYKTNIASNDLS